MTGTLPVASVAVAVPKAALIAAVVGLQPREFVVPVALMVGPVLTVVHILQVSAIFCPPPVLVTINLRQ